MNLEQLLIQNSLEQQITTAYIHLNTIYMKHNIFQFNGQFFQHQWAFFDE